MQCLLGFHNWQFDGHTCEMYRERCSRCGAEQFDYRLCATDMYNSTHPAEQQVPHDCPKTF